MSKKFSHKIIALFMALLILIPSTGLTMNVHFCKGHIEKINFLQKKNCCCDTEKKYCSDQLHQTNTKKNCCQNKTIILKKSKEKAITQNATEQKVNENFVYAFATVFVLNLHSINSSLNHFERYKPPLPEKDIQILFQTFLI